MVIDEVRQEYEPKIREILDGICKEARDRGYHCDGVDDVTDEEYQWSLFITPSEDDEERGVDISVTIVEAVVRGDDPEDGIAFSMDVVGRGGEIIGGFTPYNYGPDLWVSMSDEDAVDERWEIFDGGIDPDVVVYGIEEFWQRPPLQRAHPSYDYRDLELINRHRARLGQLPIDPDEAGWQPEDVTAEAARIRALNPAPRISFFQAASATVLSAIGVAGIVLGRRNR